MLLYWQMLFALSVNNNIMPITLNTNVDYRIFMAIFPNFQHSTLYIS